MESRGRFFALILALTVGPLTLGFVARLVLRTAFRAEEMPRAEAFVERWWTWTPLAGVVVAMWVILGPTVGIGLTVAALVLLQFADDRLDVPFRVRRSNRPR